MSQQHIPMPSFGPAFVRRFWGRVSKTDSCWFWNGVLTRSGYGRVSYKCRHFRVNRVAYFLAAGVDPVDRVVCHSCDNRACANPAHLWLGTQADNVRDSLEKKRRLPPGIHTKRHRAGLEQCLREALDNVDGWQARASQLLADVDAYRFCGNRQPHQYKKAA